MRITKAYNAYKESVIDAGYTQDIAFYENANLDDVDDTVFLCELAYVVMNSGMKNSVIQARWSSLRRAFLEFNVENIYHRRQSVRNAAMKEFGHLGKVNAIITAALVLHRWGWPKIKAAIYWQGDEVPLGQEYRHRLR